MRNFFDLICKSSSPKVKKVQTKIVMKEIKVNNNGNADEASEEGEILDEQIEVHEEIEVEGKKSESSPEPAIYKEI